MDSLVPAGAGPSFRVEPARAPSRRSKLLTLRTKGCTHALRLRSEFKVSVAAAPARLELGADLALPDAGASAAGAASAPALSLYEQLLAGAAPFAALAFQLNQEYRHHGCLRLELHRLSATRRLHLGRGTWWSLPLDAYASATFGGGMHAGVQVRRWPVALALALAMLAAGQPVHLHKQLNSPLVLDLPLASAGAKHTQLREAVEVDASLRRQQGGLQLDVRRANAILCLRHTD
ncbi:hypothetical protein C2E20_4283 [Micractinium conductrix]|uniref:Uncharacterized protein n=1 Tax=Micractinium conductrix TaxID=554055 RepID=A0A2P6VEI0_9CHLO|nr:hypothetical protein C2E20_4283 [Micractinium conductrix]|eukprot:PSC72479.1 hypothetical protein C2E20_4283 [Micractinium conductrix]